MALDLGELVGFLKLDDADFDSVADKLPAKFRGKGLALSAAAVGVGALAGKSLTDAITGAADTERTQAKITASLGLTATESSRLGKLAGDLYANNYGASMEETQDTIANVVTGIKGMRSSSDREVSAMTANVLSFASAFDVDATDAVQQVNQLISSGLAKDGPQALDLLTSAMQRVPKAVRGDLMDAVDEYAPFMKQLGLSGAQGMQLLVDATGKGMYGLDKTGDALKEFTIRSTDMSKSTTSAYKSLGLNSDDMASRILKGGKSAQGGLDLIVDRLLGMKDPVARSNTAIALFGTQMEDLGVGDVPKFLKGLKGVGKGMEDTAGSADKLNSTISGGAANSVDTLNRKWEVVTQQLVAGALPVLTQVFTFLGSNSDVLKVLAILLGGVALAVTAVTVAMWAMSLTPVAITIGLIVIGVAALIAGIVLLATHWSDVTKWIGQVWGAFCAWLADTLGGIGRWFADLWAGISSGIASAWGGVVSFLGGVLKGIVDLFLHWTLLGIIIDHWQGIVDGTRKAWGTVTSFIGGIPKAIIGFFTGVGTWLVTVGTDLLHGMIDGGKKGLIAFGRWELGIVDSVLGWVSGAARWLVGTGRDILDGLHDGAVKGLVTVGRFVLGIEDKVVGWLVGAAVWLISTGTDLLHGLASGAVKGGAAVWKFVSGIPGKVTGTLGGLGRTLWQSGADLVNGLLSGAGSILPSVGRFFLDHLPGFIREPFKKAMGIASPSKVMKELGKFVGDGLIEGLKGSGDDAAKAMDELVSKAKAVLEKKGLSKGESKLLADLRSDRVALVAEIRKRESLMSDLDDAKKALDQAKGDRTGYRDDVASAAVGGADVVAAWSDWSSKASDARKAIADAQKELDGLDSTADDYATRQAALAKTISDSQADATRSPVAALVSNLQGQLARTREFRSLLTTLRSQGLDDTTYGQLVSGGVDQGLETARSLAAGGVDAVRTITDLQGQLGDAAGELGSTTAHAMYDAGVAAAQANVDGLKANIADASTAIGLLEAQLASDIGRTGASSAALMRQAGKDMGDGLMAGLRDRHSDVAKAAAEIASRAKVPSKKKAARKAGRNIGDGLAKGMHDRLDTVGEVARALGVGSVKELKAALGIKSPSTVMMELGRYTGEGFALGVDSMADRIGASLTAATRPPEAQVPVPVGQVGANGAQTGAAGETIGVQVNVHGNVGMQPEDVATVIDRKRGDALALAGATAGAVAL